jgi:hypothetical protein
MHLTYKTDDSFFTVLMIPGDFHRASIFKWIEQSSQAKFRFIRDHEIEADYLNLHQIDDIYPGIKTIAIVTNPWLRVVRAYKTIQDLKTETALRLFPGICPSILYLLYKCVVSSTASDHRFTFSF